MFNQTNYVRKAIMWKQKCLYPRSGVQRYVAFLFIMFAWLGFSASSLAMGPVQETVTESEGAWSLERELDYWLGDQEQGILERLEGGSRDMNRFLAMVKPAFRKSSEEPSSFNALRENSFLEIGASLLDRAFVVQSIERTVDNWDEVRKTNPYYAGLSKVKAQECYDQEVQRLAAKRELALSLPRFSSQFPLSALYCDVSYWDLKYSDEICANRKESLRRIGQLAQFLDRFPTLSSTQASKIDLLRATVRVILEKLETLDKKSGEDGEGEEYAEVQELIRETWPFILSGDISFLPGASQVSQAPVDLPPTPWSGGDWEEIDVSRWSLLGKRGERFMGTGATLALDIGGAQVDDTGLVALYATLPGSGGNPRSGKNRALQASGKEIEPQTYPSLVLGDGRVYRAVRGSKQFSILKVIEGEGCLVLASDGLRLVTTKNEKITDSELLFSLPSGSAVSQVTASKDGLAFVLIHGFGASARFQTLYAGPLRQPRPIIRQGDIVKEFGDDFHFVDVDTCRASGEFVLFSAAIEGPGVTFSNGGRTIWQYSPAGLQFVGHETLDGERGLNLERKNLGAIRDFVMCSDGVCAISCSAGWLLGVSEHLELDSSLAPLVADRDARDVRLVCLGSNTLCILRANHYPQFGSPGIGCRTIELPGGIYSTEVLSAECAVAFGSVNGIDVVRQSGPGLSLRVGSHVIEGRTVDGFQLQSLSSDYLLFSAHLKGSFGSPAEWRLYQVKISDGL